MQHIYVGSPTCLLPPHSPTSYSNPYANCVACIVWHLEIAGNYSTTNYFQKQWRTWGKQSKCWACHVLTMFLPLLPVPSMLPACPSEPFICRQDSAWHLTGHTCKSGKPFQGHCFQGSNAAGRLRLVKITPNCRNRTLSTNGRSTYRTGQFCLNLSTSTMSIRLWQIQYASHDASCMLMLPGSAIRPPFSAVTGSHTWTGGKGSTRWVRGKDGPWEGWEDQEQKKLFLFLFFLQGWREWGIMGWEVAESGAFVWNYVLSLFPLSFPLTLINSVSGK